MRLPLVAIGGLLLATATVALVAAELYYAYKAISQVGDGHIGQGAITFGLATGLIALALAVLQVPLLATLALARSLRQPS